jgi:hypothetical protein
VRHLLVLTASKASRRRTSYYINDILIYSDNLKEHHKYVNVILIAIREVGLKLDIKKCIFKV